MKVWMVKRTEEERRREERQGDGGNKKEKGKEKIFYHIKNNISIVSIKITKRFHLISFNMKSFIK
jgi:hypothetical protein